MNKLWIVQKLGDGTYGDWKLFRKGGENSGLCI